MKKIVEEHKPPILELIKSVDEVIKTYKTKTMPDPKTATFDEVTDAGNEAKDELDAAVTVVEEVNTKIKEFQKKLDHANNEIHKNKIAKCYDKPEQSALHSLRAFSRKKITELDGLKTRVRVLLKWLEGIAIGFSGLLELLVLSCIATIMPRHRADLLNQMFHIEPCLIAFPRCGAFPLCG